MLENVKVGNNYQNIKTGDVYQVIGIGKNSENPSELLVVYQKKNVYADLWIRPLKLFKEKFKGVSND